MKIFDGIDNFPKLNFPVVTIGTFDGVHVGHQKILSRIIELARKHDGKTVLITFWPHPRFVLNNDNSDLKLLSTFEEKASYLRKLGIDHLVKIPFTKSFSENSSDSFIQKILVEKIGTKKLVIGYDHKFGKNREGSFEHLKANEAQYGFEVEEISRQDIDDVGVSSTKIRKALEEGEIDIANEYLGRFYSLAGNVVKGQQLGRSLGFPTANIQLIDSYKLVPGDGVYAVEVMHKAHLYDGMLNIGYRPTVDGITKVMEVNIFNFDEDIYHQDIRIFYVKKIRDERKFSGVEELKAQLTLDKKAAEQILTPRL